MINVINAVEARVHQVSGEKPDTNHNESAARLLGEFFFSFFVFFLHFN